MFTVRLLIASVLAQKSSGDILLSLQELEKVPGVVPAVQLKMAVVPEKWSYAQVPEPGTASIALV